MNSISRKCIICNDTGIINKGTSVQEDCFKCKVKETEWEARERCGEKPFDQENKELDLEALWEKIVPKNTDEVYAKALIQNKYLDLLHSQKAKIKKELVEKFNGIILLHCGYKKCDCNTNTLNRAIEIINKL